jgi:hypothetical protein
MSIDVTYICIRQQNCASIFLISMTRICDDSSFSEDTTDVDCLARFPLTQKALVLYGFGQQYVLKSQYAVPVVRSSDEMLIKVESIGLNPIDWKAT